MIVGDFLKNSTPQSHKPQMRQVHLSDCGRWFVVVMKLIRHTCISCHQPSTRAIMGNCSAILGNKARTTTCTDLGKQLHDAVWLDNHDLAKKLIADGAQLEATDDVFGYTPLHNAVHKGHVEMVKLLVAEGADKEALDSVGLTPLVAAANRGQDTVVETLLAAGADASLRCGRSTALDLAAMRGYERVLAVLIRHGVDVNDVSILGTALHWAARMKQPDVIDVLVAAGADTEARNMNGFTPLHMAVERFGREAAVACLKHGALINVRDKFGLTPLHLAAQKAGKRGAVEMVDLLLRWGADEAATNVLEKTPAEVAGNKCSDSEEAGGVERVRELLANATAARAWHRRGLLVSSRARPPMVTLNARTQARRELIFAVSRARERAREEWMDLMGRVLGLAQEGVFRTIVGYL